MRRRRRPSRIEPCRLRRGNSLPDATGVVLAGGRSTRFGRDKLAEPYQGEPLLHHAVARLAEVCDEIVVVIAPDAPAPSLPVGPLIRVARDESEGQGPLAGMVAALPTVTTTFAIVAAGDMPELQASVLEMMLGSVADGDAVALADGSDVRPLPCVVRVERAAEVAPALLASGRASVRALLAQLRVNAVDEPTWTALDPKRRTLFDVDLPGDLA